MIKQAVATGPTAAPIPVWQMVLVWMLLAPLPSLLPLPKPLAAVWGVVGLIAYPAIAWWSVRSQRGRLAQGLSLRPAGPMACMAPLLALIGLWWFTGQLATLGSFQAAQAQQRGAMAQWELTLLMVVLAPMFEELVFRGWLLVGLRQRLPDGAAILASAVVFASVHPVWIVIGLPTWLATGLVTAWATVRTGSLLPAFVAHVVGNATSVFHLGGIGSLVTWVPGGDSGQWWAQAVVAAAFSLIGLMAVARQQPPPAAR